MQDTEQPETRHGQRDPAGGAQLGTKPSAAWEDIGCLPCSAQGNAAASWETLREQAGNRLGLTLSPSFPRASTYDQAKLGLAVGTWSLPTPSPIHTVPLFRHVLVPAAPTSSTSPATRIMICYLLLHVVCKVFYSMNCETVGTRDADVAFLFSRPHPPSVVAQKKAVLSQFLSCLYLTFSVLRESCAASQAATPASEGFNTTFPVRQFSRLGLLCCFWLSAASRVSQQQSGEDHFLLNTKSVQL